MQSQTVIVCEGYDDRSFWAGMLEHRFGAKSLHDSHDPWGVKIVKGHFGYLSSQSQFIRVVPIRGPDVIQRGAKPYLLAHATRKLTRLLINRDRDTKNPTRASELIATLQEVDPTVRESTETTLSAFTDAVKIHLIDWRSPDVELVGVPKQQTLERLVCHAITTAYPNRAEPVKRWLASAQPDNDPDKAHAWSYMAGWYAEHGCSDFYKEVWRDNRIAAALQNLLAECSLWKTIEDAILDR